MEKNNNPITTIDEHLFILIKEQMNTEEQLQFINSFKMYLKYGNDNTKFIINLDDIWVWIGFSEKGKAKRLLINKFDENIDYILLAQNGKQKFNTKNLENRGGHNKESILLINSKLKI